MVEAILFIWLGAGHSQVLSTIRYEDMQLCETARAVVLKHVDNAPGMLFASQSGNIKCLPVKKAQ